MVFKYLIMRPFFYILYMDERLYKMFEESRKRHQNDKPKRGRPPKVKPIKEKNTPTETELKEKRAKALYRRYNSIDREKFGVVGDLDYQWIISNIFNTKCEYCGESDWHKLGCDRIDNSKGHTKDNCVCACRRCNMLRGNKFSVEDMKEIGEVLKRIEHRNTVYKVAKKRGKKIAKLDKDRNVIKTYPAIVEVAADGYSRNCVNKAVRYKYKGSNLYRNYYWEYI